MQLGGGNEGGEAAMDGAPAENGRRGRRRNGMGDASTDSDMSEDTKYYC